MRSSSLYESSSLFAARVRTSARPEGPRAPTPGIPAMRRRGKRWLRTTAIPQRRRRAPSNGLAIARDGAHAHAESVPRSRSRMPPPMIRRKQALRFSCPIYTTEEIVEQLNLDQIDLGILATPLKTQFAEESVLY